MRIISGKHKNRVIPTSQGADYRPSTSKFREAVFNILSSGEFSGSNPLIDADILDLFAGTGSLSFEALSRGAKKASLVDINGLYLKQAKKFAEKIGEEDNITTYTINALNFRIIGQKFSLIFLDPPYKTDYLGKILVHLKKNQIPTDGAILVIEMSKYEDLKIIDNYLLIKEKTYGNNKLIILKYEQK